MVNEQLCLRSRYKGRNCQTTRDATSLANCNFDSIKSVSRVYITCPSQTLPKHCQNTLPPSPRISMQVSTPKPFSFDDDDEDGWQDMPVIRDDEFAGGLDEEDRKKYHYVAPASAKQINATGNLIDFDDSGQEWRTKDENDLNENEYTRLRVNEEDDSDEVHLRTKYLFDEDKAMTPLSQMQATKNLLTEAQRVAYVGLCALTVREMSDSLTASGRKELKAAKASMDLWALKIMGRLYYHMELATEGTFVSLFPLFVR